MSGTKMTILWLLTVLFLAAICSFVAGWISERKQRKENPTGPRHSYKEQVAGFFLMGCANVVMTVWSSEIEMRAVYGVAATVMFLAAVVLQKRVQQNMTSRPAGGVLSAESPRLI